jgi:hypothetical protein
MCKFKSDLYQLTDRCDIFNTMQKYYFTYFYEYKCGEAIVFAIDPNNKKLFRRVFWYKSNYRT